MRHCDRTDELFNIYTCNYDFKRPVRKLALLNNFSCTEAERRQNFTSSSHCVTEREILFFFLYLTPHTLIHTVNSVKEEFFYYLDLLWKTLNKLV